MLERDDEDLAIEQLPGAGRADDPELAGSRALAAELPQERAAALAEPAPPAAATRGAAAGAARAHRGAAGAASGAAAQQLERIEDLDRRRSRSQPARGIPRAARGAARAQTAIRTRARPHAGERTQLTSALQERARARTCSSGADLERELGDPPEMRAERDGLERAISELHRERRVRDELAERELHAPGAWVRDTFGERPMGCGW